MKIEIFEIDLGTTGDLYMVTKTGNQILIPNGESLFETWSDRHGLTRIDVEPEYDAEDTDYSMSREYDKSVDLMREFAMSHKHLWRFDRDGNGELYGNPAEEQNPE